MLSKHFSGSDLSILETELVRMDPVTGLILPYMGTQMLVANGDVVDIPPSHFFHPQTGHILPIAGNISYDPVTSRLIFTVDSATGEASRTEEQLIPFVPYPVNPHSGRAVATKLKPLARRGDLKYAGPMPDPSTGIHVPILGVTIHPDTGAVLPVAGTHTDPVTGLPVAIEIGSMMVDPISEQPVPILALALDQNTG